MLLAAYVIYSITHAGPGGVGQLEYLMRIVGLAGNANIPSDSGSGVPDSSDPGNAP